MNVTLNVPVIMLFRDYHEIKYVEDYFNELILTLKIKSKEMKYLKDGKYAAIFYFTQDEKYHRMVKEFNILNKEDNEG